MNKNFKHLASAGAFAFFLFIAMGSMDDDKKSGTGVSTTSTATNGEAKANYKKVGETLPTEYFEVTVNKVSVKNTVSTGNEFSNLPAESGTRYLIINTTFKNISNESRSLFDGEVLVNYNGKDYTFDKAEPMMIEGWGLMLDEINPLTTKTTNLVYKIPAELKGTAFYNPARSGSDDLIDLGNIE